MWGDRVAERLPEAFIGARGLASELWNSKNSALVLRAEITDRRWDAEQGWATLCLQAGSQLPSTSHGHHVGAQSRAYWEAGERDCVVGDLSVLNFSP